MSDVPGTHLRLAASGGGTDTVEDQLARARLVALATIQPELAEPLGRVLLVNGLSCIEITFRAPGAPDAIKRAREVEGLLVGAGTVLSPDQASAAAAAGASFAVAPCLNEAVIERCAELGLPFFPGVATPSEIDRAQQLGLHTVKAFPISALGGVSFLRAVAAVYPDVRFIPTGGVDAANLSDYLALPNVLACGGSWIAAQELLRSGDLETVALRAREAVKLVNA